jgi:adenylyltransferase/sulfurtransferase
VLLGKPYVWGSIFRFEGQCSVFWAEQGPCYRCLYPEPPPPGMVPSCAEGGVLGVLCATIGSIQATEAVKLVIGKGMPLIGRLKLYDAMEMSLREIAVRKDPECPICGKNPTITELIDYEEFCGLTRGEEDTSLQDQVPAITPSELAGKAAEGHLPVLVDVREPFETEISNLPWPSRLIPLNEVVPRVHELSSADDVVLYCRTGARSAQAAQFLQSIGFKKVKNLRGGVNGFAEEVDPSIPVY